MLQQGRKVLQQQEVRQGDPLSSVVAAAAAGHSLTHSLPHFVFVSLSFVKRIILTTLDTPPTSNCISNHNPQTWNWINQQTLKESPP